MIPSRINLINIGNELRNKYGPEILAIRTVNKINTQYNVVIDSIRHPAEANILKKLLSINYNYKLWGITASTEIRFERLKQRNRIGDIETLEMFKQIEALEFSNQDPNGQQISALFPIADNILINNDTQSKFQDIIESTFKSIFLSK